MPIDMTKIDNPKHVAGIANAMTKAFNAYVNRHMGEFTRGDVFGALMLVIKEILKSSRSQFIEEHGKDLSANLEISFLLTVASNLGIDIHLTEVEG